MNIEHFQKNTAYLDGLLLSLQGDKVVTITYGTQPYRFYVTEAGDVSGCSDEGPVASGESAFELYRMSFLEALIGGGSLIIRQLGVGQLSLPEALGGGTVPLDTLCGAALGTKGVRGLKATELRSMHPQRAQGGIEFRDLPTKEQVKVALIKQIDDQNPVPETVAKSA